MGAKPTILVSEDQLAGILRGRRQNLGITVAELDHRIGWPEGYAAKVEAPSRKYGRRAAWGLAATLFNWLDALGLCIVVMPRKQAEALIAASDDALMAVSEHTPYAGRSRERPLMVETVRTVRFTHRRPMAA